MRHASMLRQIFLGEAEDGATGADDLGPKRSNPGAPKLPSGPQGADDLGPKRPGSGAPKGPRPTQGADDLGPKRNRR